MLHEYCYTYLTHGASTRATTHAYRFRRASKMKRAKSSTVWDHFERKADEVTCKICNAVFKYSSSTSTMQNHLRSKHPQSSCDEGQQTLPSILAGRSCDARRSEEITQRICSMVVKDILPIGVVCGEGFQELLGYIEPNYEIPSRYTITHRIEACFEERKKKNRLKRNSVAQSVWPLRLTAGQHSQRKAI